MLVLARKKGQLLRIGDNVIISIVDVQGDQVRLGISAPREIQVLRQELYDAVKVSNQQAAGAIQHLAAFSAALQSNESLSEKPQMKNQEKNENK